MKELEVVRKGTTILHAQEEAEVMALEQNDDVRFIFNGTPEIVTLDQAMVKDPKLIVNRARAQIKVAEERAREIVEQAQKNFEKAREHARLIEMRRRERGW